jgi:hypothetical protein
MMTQNRNLVQDQVRQIREYINNPHKHYELRQNKALFHQLCSSLDVIGDTDEAITAFEERKSGDSKAAHYLAVYGLLQAIYVQQDAAINLCESLSIPENINKHPKLVEIRKVRNDVVGHPTKGDGRKGMPTSHHIISRMSLTEAGFTLLSLYSDGTSKHEHINIPELLNEQTKHILEILSMVIRRLDAEEKTHKEKFRVEKLANVFPDVLTYHFEKIFEGIFRDDYAELSAGDLEQVAGVLHDFRTAIGRRNMDYYEKLEDEYDLIEHAVSHLREYFRSKIAKGNVGIDHSAARIYAMFLRGETDSLRQQAIEIDEEYES